MRCVSARAVESMPSQPAARRPPLCSPKLASRLRRRGRTQTNHFAVASGIRGHSGRYKILRIQRVSTQRPDGGASHGVIGGWPVGWVPDSRPALRHRPEATPSASGETPAPHPRRARYRGWPIESRAPNRVHSIGHACRRTGSRYFRFDRRKITGGGNSARAFVQGVRHSRFRRRDQRSLGQGGVPDGVPGHEILRGKARARCPDPAKRYAAARHVSRRRPG